MSRSNNDGGRWGGDFVREGDFVKYEDHYYEIVELKEPSRLFGQDKEVFEINAICRKAREGSFNAK